jgi:hypothetical protein
MMRTERDDLFVRRAEIWEKGIIQDYQGGLSPQRRAYDTGIIK